LSVFVYGTLREGQSLSSLIPADVERWPARTRGRLHYTSANSPIPILLPNEPGMVIGEWLNVSMWRIAESVLSMEVEAGYNAEWRTVYVDNGNGSETTVSAVVFTAPGHETPADLGPRVRNNDYVRRHA
jgi:gamma-glutamylcyclotransferase (GGCT)/AIG2-like uncharacterized protein YtfP